MSSISHTTKQLDFKVLNFFIDDGDNCALTVLINEVRFHIIVDTCKVKRGKTGQEYARLLQAVKEDDIEDFGEASSGIDSGIDVNDEKEDRSKAQASPEEALHLWMLAPLQYSIDELAPQSASPPSKTLEEWFAGPTNFFDLETEDGELRAVELEPNDELDGRISKLLPQISVPKYVRNLPVPWYSAGDLVILDGSDAPPPYRPSRVQIDGQVESEVFFLKLVDTSQPGPTKRELSLLSKVAQEGLHEHIRCPKLEGLVTLSGDRSKIMGFLQTDIPSPVPLTWKLDEEVPQELRDRWADEAERVKEVLHEHGIVWGDAKADNFMVDEDDELWIIDFGGSYTEGWVDPELNETEEGDDMGVEKIANALHDPVANTWDPDTERSFGGSSHASEKGERGRKRKTSEAVDGDVKRQKYSAGTEPRYCYCDSASSGKMIACDASNCERQWFHFECIGIDAPPPDGEAWYCEDCRLES